MFKLIYSFLYAVALTIVLPVLYLYYKKKGYDFHLKERFLLKKLNTQKPTIWIHCASVGEIKTVLPIINYLKSYQDYEILLTIFSVRAYDFAVKNLNDIKITYLPFDLSFLIKKFIKNYKPKILIIQEAEFWFNLITSSCKYIPVISINTSISEKSKRNITRFRFYFKPILNSFSKIIVRTKEDREFLSQFVNPSKIDVCGNLKLLSEVKHKEVNLEKAKKIILGASTHSPEEEILIKVYKEIKDDQTMLILAPRHLERINEIINLIENHGLSYGLRSKNSSLDAQVYIIDTMGELTSFFKYADAVFVGGTIASIGGHNILEPILSGKKVIIGKNYFKIKDLVELAKSINAVDIIENEIELKNTILKHLKNSNIDIDLEALRKDIYNCYIKSIKEVLNG
ncbi:glycosyltransferase N-terminal domain-containing protein [Sulfurihydrogenibium sp.]|jgi:3-deoxy-D-manno-octulosonic-acid transferase|uniref:3-deoxy-D-manno-octulosonic acid transferase n=1 Tax=Sulfurihydrogenibium sp. TaxID=2053621 RepID=UPI00260A4FB4|nr:glycosyltransferase N-terminal domain-containing protein [Sulfurihydrogenibium sp.]